MKRAALESLAGFLDRISEPGFVAGEWVTRNDADDGIMHIPYVQLFDVAQEFHDEAYKSGWLDTKFDWSSWAETSKASQLMREPRAITNAGPKDLFRLLTVSIRRDKYSEGSLLNDFETGLILSIVRRAAEIVDETKSFALPLRKLSSAQAGGLGELLALAKLNSLGLAAYMSPEGAPGHDLITIVGGEAKSIEVKTRQFRNKPTEITRWPVDLQTKGDADFFLFVELDLKTISPTFYILTNEQARSINKSFGNGQGNCYPAQVRLLAAKNDFSALLL